MHVCTTHINNYDELERVLINKIKDECHKYIDRKMIENSVDINSLELNNTVKIKNEINLIKNEIEKINSNLDTMYIDKLNNIIDENQFKRIKSSLELNIENKNKRLNELNDMLKCDKYTLDNNKKIEKFIKDFLELDNPSRELIVNLVEKVSIYQDKRIDLKLSFNKI